MIEKKGIFVMLLAAVFLLAFSGLVSASSVTINVPIAGQEVNGTSFSYNLTLNVSTEDAASGVTNVTLTVGSTVLDYEDNVNYTEGITELSNRTLDTSGLTDGSNVITVSLYNETDTTATTGTITVTSDNTVPTTISAVYNAQIKKGASMTVDLSSSDTTAVTYSTTLVSPDGNTVSGFPKTGSSITIGGDEIGSQGTYTMTVTVTDNLGYSAESSFSLEVGSSTVPSQLVVQKAETVKQVVSGDSARNIVLLGGGAILLVAIVLMAGGLGGKKRR